MRRRLEVYTDYQVFLNYPYDEDFAELSQAMAFGVAAGGLIPVTARDCTEADRPRLASIADAMTNCRYSAHDLSRSTGGGPGNFARMNMPLELGMALGHALASRRVEHRCAIFVSRDHEHSIFASDLSGLDPKSHQHEPERMVKQMYEWLRATVPLDHFNLTSLNDVIDSFHLFLDQLQSIAGASVGSTASHVESRELLFRVCERNGWWDWRNTRAGELEFPRIPLPHDI